MILNIQTRNPKQTIYLWGTELKYKKILNGLFCFSLNEITFTTLFSRGVDVVHLSNLFVGLLPCTVAKVDIDVDTTGVIEAWSVGALRGKGTSQDKLRKEYLYFSNMPIMFEKV